jgi:hypothetical protein
MHAAEPQPQRGRAHARLQAHLEGLDRLDPDRSSASERLVLALGSELARTLVSAGGRRCGVRPA